MYLRASAILGLHALFALLTVSRVLSPEERSWNWALVFTPLFVFDALAVVGWFLYLISYVVTKFSYDSAWSGRKSVLFPAQAMSLVYLIAFGIAIPLKTTAEILLVLRLQGVSSVSLVAPAALLILLFLEVACVALLKALSPVLKMWVSDFQEDLDLDEFDCFTCLGYTNLCLRRCLYHKCC